MDDFSQLDRIEEMLKELLAVLREFKPMMDRYKQVAGATTFRDIRKAVRNG